MPDATADYAGLAFADRDALVAYMRENLGPAIVTMHHVPPPGDRGRRRHARPAGGTSTTR